MGKLIDKRKLKKQISRTLLKYSLIGFLMLSSHIFSQDNTYVKGKEYIIEEISVLGLKTFNEQTVITYTGLRKGQQIRIPGEEISAIISKLWKLDLFSNINFYLSKINGNSASLEIVIEELPTLSEYKITGLKKSKIETIVSETELKKGKKITENFIKTTKNYIINKFKKDGFLNTKVSVNVIPDTAEVNYSKMLIKVDIGDKTSHGKGITIVNFYTSKYTCLIHYGIRTL